MFLLIKQYFNQKQVAVAEQLLTILYMFNDKSPFGTTYLVVGGNKKVRRPKPTHKKRKPRFVAQQTLRKMGLIILT